MILCCSIRTKKLGQNMTPLQATIAVKQRKPFVEVSVAEV